MADSDVPGLTQVTPTLTGITYQVNDPNGGSEAEGYSTNQQLMDLFEANIVLATARITSGTFADARIAESNVTQHEAALSITESQISDFGSYQPLDADLTAIAGLSSADGNVIVGSDSGWVAEAGATARASLGLTIGTDVAAEGHSHTLADVTDSGALAALDTVGTAQIDDAAVTYAKMQDVSATSRFIGRITAGAGAPEELSGTQATTLLDTFTDALKGLAPASGGGTDNFLRADGTWAAPAGGASAIDDLTDVSITTPADNEVLAFDNGSGEWINQTAAEAGLATAAQGALADSALQPSDIASGTITARADDIDLSGGSDGDVLTVQADGSLALEAAAGGGGSPGGSDTQVQFNDGGAFGGDAGMTYAKATDTLTVAGAVRSGPGDEATPAFASASAANLGIAFENSHVQLVERGHVLAEAYRSNNDDGHIKLQGPLHLGFRESQTSAGASASDTFITRPASGVLAQRGDGASATTAQAGRWFNTFTDASNGEYAHASWKETANIFEIATKAVGTGTQRSMSITAGSANILMPDLPTSDPSVAGALWNNSGVLTVSAG